MIAELTIPAPARAILDDEPGRIRAIERTGLRDAPPDPEFDAITALVRDVFDVPICAVTLIDSERQFCKAATGIEAGAGPRSDAFCDHTIREKDVLVVEDARLDARFCNNPAVVGAPFVRSYAGAPLITPEGYQIGALCVVDRRPRDFSPEERSRLQRFAAIVVEAIELRTQAREDYLTGARTRRGFADELRSALGRYRRGGELATLITLDIDHFKAVNDRFGHAAGDVVLRSVAQALRATLRDYQTLGRLGGEEFGVLLPGAGAADAQVCAERMRSAIEQLDIPAGGPVTASFGVAPLGVEETIEEWAAASDRALYRAKREGRNRCVLARSHEQTLASPPVDGTG